MRRREAARRAPVVPALPSRVGDDAGLRAYMLGVYGYMTLGLAVSGLVALSLASLARRAPGVAAALDDGAFKWPLALAPLAFVIAMALGAQRLSKTALLAIFLAFAATTGLSLGVLGRLYEEDSIVKAMLIAAAAFGALSLYGYRSRRDLSGMAAFVLMGLVGVVLAGLAKLYFRSDVAQTVTSLIGVVVFAGLTAWDTQRLRDAYDENALDPVWVAKSSIMGALSLYLNVLNIFLKILSLIGRRRA